VTSQLSGKRVRLSLEALEDRMALSGMGSLPPLPTGTPLGLLPAPSGLTPPPDLTSLSQLLSGPWLTGQLPSNLPPLPTGTPVGLMPAPSGLTPPPAFTPALQLPGFMSFTAPVAGWYPGTQQAPPGAPPPTVAPDQIFAELAAMLSELAAGH
jgi:hypothetical protein